MVTVGRCMFDNCKDDRSGRGAAPYRDSPLPGDDVYIYVASLNVTIGGAK